MQPFNFITMQQYSGKNVAELIPNGEIPAFATFKQLKDAGYSVKKGAKSVAIFCGYREKKDSDKKVPRWGRVFEIIDTSANDDKQFIEHLIEQVTGKK